MLRSQFVNGCMRAACLLIMPLMAYNQDCFKSAFTSSDIDLSGSLTDGKIAMKKTAVVKVSIKNVGLCVWEPYDINLRVKVVGSPSGASTYSLQDLVPDNGGTLPLKNRVLPKDNVDFFYSIVMDDPKTVSGRYKLRFQLYAKGKAFEADVDKEVEVVNHLQEDGDCRMMANITSSGIKFPSKILSGKKIPVSIGVDNTGTCRWDMDRNKIELRVNVVSWPDIGAGEKEKLTPSGENFLVAQTSSDIEAGAQADFNYTITGPSAPGTYKVEFQMTNQRKPFGPRFLREIVVVGDPKNCDADPEISVSGFPSATKYNDNYVVTVKVTNHGDCDWTADTKVEVRAKLVKKPSGVSSSLQDLLPDDGIWALGSKIVKPGDSFEFKYTIYGPYVPGTYGMYWEVYVKGATTGKYVGKTLTVSVPK